MERHRTANVKRFTVGPKAQARAVARHRVERSERQRDLDRRLLAAYQAEPDREYAEAFYGSLLAERGVSFR